MEVTPENAQSLVKELQASEDRFQSFIGSCSEQVWCVGFEPPIPLDIPEEEQAELVLSRGVYVQANEEFAQAYGATLDEVIGWPLQRTLQRELPTTMPFLREVVAAGFSMRDSRSFEIAKDGTSRVMLNNFNPIFSDGKLMRVWGTARDVSDLEKSANAIKLRSTVVETMRDGCVIVDAQAEDMPIVYVNEQFCQMTKYSDAEVMGRNCRFLQGPGTCPETSREINDAIAKRARFHGEVLNYRKDGKTFWNLLRLAPVFGSDGVLTHYVGIQSDITGRKRLEKELLQKNRTLQSEIKTRTQAQQQLENLSARLIHAQEEERRRLSRDLHDDLTQRIAALAMEVGRIAGALPGPPGRAGEGLARIGHELSELAGDTQELSRRLHPKILEELGLSEAIKAECRRFNRRHQVETLLSIDDLEGRLTLDVSICVYRILQESLANVAKHASADRVTVELLDDGDEVTLTVCDNGAGFDDGKALPSGSLGLISMAERARLSAGDLKIDSTPGAGTTVGLTLRRTANSGS